MWAASGPKEVQEVITDLNKTLEELAKEFEDAGVAGEEMGNKISKAMAKAKTPMQAMRTYVEELAKKYPKATAAGIGFADGIVNGLKFVTNLMTSALGLVESVGKAFIDIGLSIATLPFRSLEGLISVSNKLAPLLTSIAQATEEIRKQFGDISKGPAQDVIKAANEVGKGFENIGLSGFQVFGSLDERLQAVNKIATAMGATFESFGDEFKKAGGGVLLLQRGLGIADENMKSIAIRAKTMGTSMQTQLQRMTKFSVDFSKKFGISQKFISRDMGIMTDDVANFGLMAPKDLAKVSVYARKLGIDIKDLLGVVDKFDTFESAAESAAMLSQAFGANIDAIGMMKEQDPAKRIDMLKQSMKLAGQTSETMNRQQLKLLKTITGLDEKTNATVFSNKNLGVSYNDLEKQGKVTEQRQLSTAEAVLEIKKSIEKTIKPMGTFEGFLKAFADGFARGIFVQEDFRTMLTRLNRGLAEVKRTGIEVGKAFASMPFIKDITTSIAAFLDLGTSEKHGAFRKFLHGIRDDFTKFFKDLTDGKASLPALMKTLKKKFWDYFSPDKPESKKLIAGLSKFGEIISQGIAGLIDTVAGGVTETAKILTDLIDGKGLPKMGAAGGFLSNLLTPIIDALKKAWPKVSDALVELLKTAWTKARPYLITAAEEVLPIVLGLVVSAGVIKAAVNVALEEAGKFAIGFIKKQLAKQLATTMAEEAAAAAAKAAAAEAAETASVEAAVFEAAGTSEMAIAAAAGGEAAGTGFVSSFAAVLTGPVGIAAAVVLAFAAVGAVLTKVLDYVEAPFHEVFDGILGSLIESGKETFAAMGKFITQFFSGDNLGVLISSENLGEKLATLIENIVLEAVAALPMIVETIVGGLGKLVYWSVLLSIRAVEGLFGILGGMFKKWGGDLINAFSFKWSSLGAVLAQPWKEFVVWLKDLFGIHSPSKLMVDLGKDLVDGIKVFLSAETFGDIAKSMLSGLKNGLAGVADIMTTPFSSALKGVKDVFGIHSASSVMREDIAGNLMSGLEDGLKKIPDVMGNISFDGLRAFAGEFDSVLKSAQAMGRLNDEAAKMPWYMGTGQTPAAQVITALVNEANLINKELADLPPVDVRARLQDLAGKLGIDKQTFTIDSKKVNVIINLDVTMEADKLAKILSEHGIVSTENTKR